MVENAAGRILGKYGSVIFIGPAVGGDTAVVEALVADPADEPVDEGVAGPPAHALVAVTTTTAIACSSVRQYTAVIHGGYGTSAQQR